MHTRHVAAGTVSVLFAVVFALDGCHSTTVSVVAEAPDAPPELIVEIKDFQAGQVGVSNTSEKDWMFGKTHNTTKIQVPPGSKIVVIPSSRPRHDRLMSVPASCPATCPDTQPESAPAE